jgi:hypothetical protein
MLKVLLLLTFIIIGGCARARKVQLKSFSYELGEHAKIAIDSLKRNDHKIEISILALSVGETVVLKPGDIECGAGDVKFSKVSIKSKDDKLIICPKIAYSEFAVKCYSIFEVPKDKKPYLLFKKIYKLQNDGPGEILEKDIKIEFE